MERIRAEKLIRGMQVRGCEFVYGEARRSLGDDDDDAGDQLSSSPSRQGIDELRRAKKL